MSGFSVPPAMPQRCRICDHPQQDEINSHIINGTLSMRKVADKYKTDEHPISYSGVRHHKAKHLQKIIDQVTEEHTLATKGEVMKTIDAYNTIIERLPQVIDNVSLNLVLKTLEARSRLLGEEKQPPRIIIEWGLGLDKEHLKSIEARYKVIPAEQLPAPELDLINPKDYEDTQE